MQGIVVGTADIQYIYTRDNTEWSIIMNNKQTAHIISHTHWDREWYINSKFVNEWLPPFFEGLFGRMDENSNYKFVLDGQTSILDDCYVELEKLGKSVSEFKDKLRQYAQRGQLVIGPYYLQPDWQLVSAESLVRNMLIGKTMSEELGGGTQTGWLLDNFGQISQAPQLHKQFDMKGIVVWRGVELDPFNLNSEFEWKGADGTKIVCSYLLSSYRNAMHLADYPEIIYERIQNEVEKIAPFATTGNILLMNGYDQEMQPDDILPFIEDGKADFKNYTIRQSTPNEYMQAVVDGRGELQQLEGALYSGRYISVFPGILSARMYLKTANYYAQRELEFYAEPLNAMRTVLTGAEYPHAKMDKAWKLLLKNHPHDSICAVSVDNVHYDMEERYEETLGLSKDMTQTAASALANSVDTSMFDGSEAVFTVFNTLSTPRTASVFLPTDNKNVSVKDENGNVCKSSVCEGGVIAIVNLKATSSLSLGLYSAADAAEQSANNDLTAENEFLKVVCNGDGTLDVTDKATGKLYSSIGALENMADNGDEYNYSFLKGDKPLTTKGQAAKVSVLTKNDVQTSFLIEIDWSLPKSLSDKRDKRSDETLSLPIVTKVTLTAGDPVLRFETSVRNICKDHRIRVLFPTQINTDVSYAQTQFDVTKHPIMPKEFDNDSIPENVKRIIIGARESIPITQFPQKDFCALSDGKITAAVLNYGLPEYEVLQDKNTVALTLFRSLGWLARFDLNTRVGDAGPEMLTPGAQCLRDMSFTYGFCSTTFAPTSAELDSISTNFATPPLTVKNTVHSGAKTGEFVEVLSANAHVSALKCADNSNEIVLRVYNQNSEKTTAKIKLSMAQKAYYSTPYESKNAQITLNDNCIELPLNSKEIVTVRCEVASPILGTAQDGTAEVSTATTAPLNVDFKDLQIPVCVTPQEIESENVRAGKAEALYEAKLDEANKAQAELDSIESPTPAQKTNAATLMMQAHALHRAALEARLSAIFAEETYKRETLGKDSAGFIDYQNSTVEKLRELAYGLNLARIDKRVSEYITDYYVHKEKTLKN